MPKEKTWPSLSSGDCGKKEFTRLVLFFWSVLIPTNMGPGKGEEGWKDGGGRWKNSLVIPM